MGRIGGLVPLHRGVGELFGSVGLALGGCCGGGVDVVWVRLVRFRFFTRRMVFCITLAGFDVRVG